MIRHILYMIWNQRTSNVWIWLEMVMISTILWFAVDVLYTYTVTWLTPLGYDVNNTYKISFGEYPEMLMLQKPTADEQEAYTLKIIERIEAHPEVEAVSLTNMSLPFAGSSRYNHFNIDSLHSYSTLTLFVNPGFFEVFRYAGEQGRNNAMANALSQPNSLIISSELAQQVSGKESPIGKEVYCSEGTFIVRAVAEHYRRGVFVPQEPFHFRLYTRQEFIRNGLGRSEIAVRVKQGVRGDFRERFVKDMKHQLQLGNYYLKSVKSMNQIGVFLDRVPKAEIKSNALLILFLLTNIFLGVIGTFWYKTEQRRGELGVRMAMGSTRKELCRMMLNESLLILFFAWLPAILISYNIAAAQLVVTNLLPFTIMRFVICQIITFLLLILMMWTSVGIPTRLAVRLHPSDALRYD